MKYCFLRSTALLSAALLTCALMGCVHTYPPNERDALMRTSPLEQIGGEGERGELMLLAEGHWALIESTSVKAKDRLEPGTLVTMSPGAASGDAKKSDNHLFVVLVSRDWGMYLARLDHKPVSPQIPMASAPLTAKDTALLARHGACLVEGTLEDNPCIGALPDNSRIDLYALDKEGLVSLGAAIEDDTYRLAAMPAAYIHKEAGRIEFIGPSDRLPERALAIAHPAPHRLPARPNIAHAPSCAPMLAGKGLDRHANLIEAPLNADDLTEAHILDLEAMAMTHGADVLVHCDSTGERVIVGAPQLGREWMRSRLDFDLGPAVLGASALELRRVDAASARAVVMSMGLMALGDSHAASTWITAAMGEGYNRELDKFFLRSAQLLAHGGYPEQGLRVAHGATRDAWNRRENLAYALMMSTMWSAIGQEHERIVQEGVLAEQTERSRESSLQAWTFWRSASLAMIGGEISSQTQVDAIGKDTSERDKDQEGYRKWKLALHASHLLQTEANGRDEAFERVLLAAAKKQGVGPLFEMILSNTAPEPSSEPCPLDVYGRCLGSQTLSPKEYATALRRLSRAPLRPWFTRANHSPEDALLALSVGLFQRPSGKEKSAIFAHVGSALADDTTRGELCAMSKDIEAMGRGFAARQQTPELERAAIEIEWLARDVIPAACKGWEQAAEAVAEGEKDRRLYGLILLEKMLSRDPARRFEELAILARLGSERASRAQCQRYNVASALALLESGLIERANEAALAALNCRHKGESRHEKDANVTVALIAYEQYGKIPSSFPPALEAELEKLPEDERYAWCPGLSYSAPNFKALIDTAILAIAMDAKQESKGTEDNLRILRASEATELARAAIKDAWVALGKPWGYAESAKILRGARETAARANAPEVSRQLEYIEKHLYQGSFDKVIEDWASRAPAKPDASSAKKPAAKKLTPVEALRDRIEVTGDADVVRQELEETMVEGASEILFALTLLSGDITDLERVTKAHGKGADSVPTLCAPRTAIF